MLNIEVNRSAEGVERYFDRELAVSDYLMKEPGIWAGRGAERLGLRGPVQRTQFVALLRIEDPASGKRLTVRMNTSRRENGEMVSNRQVGYGLVFGVPKSVSIYLAITGDEVVENIARSSVDETMQAMESEMQCKVRKGGMHEDRTTGEMLYSKFFHRDSRPINGLSDPHWHIHCFLHNATFDPVEKRWNGVQALAAFAEALRLHGGDPSQIEAIAMDMSTSYMKGASQYFPQARIVFDKFHVMVLAGKALEEVRLQLQREGAQLKGAMWSLRGNAWNLSQERQEQRQDLCRQYTKLGRAMSLREALQDIYASSDRQVAEAQLKWWCGWAARSRLYPFRHLAMTVRQQWEGILAYFDTKLTSAAIEAVNGIIQLAKRMARGFRNFVYFRTAAYHRASQLNLAVPTIT